jgi:mono/diheme cytochrome c family protein
MLETVTSGREKTAMVGWGRKLSPQQIEAVVDYVRASFVDGQAATASVAAVPPAPPAPGAHAAMPPAEPRPSAAATPPQAAAAPAAGAHGHGDAHAAHASAMPPGLVGNAHAGEDLYRRNCVACHGEQGNGQGPRAYFINPKPQNFTSAAARSSLDRAHLYASISRGVTGTEMPAWEKVLTPQQIADLGEYVFTRFIQAAPPAADAPAKKN